MNQATTKSGMATKQSLKCQIPPYGGVELPFLKGDLEGFLFCHCEARECRSNLYPTGIATPSARNDTLLLSLRGTPSFCSATLQGRAVRKVHEAKASHYIFKLCSVILPFDFLFFIYFSPNRPVTIFPFTSKLCSATLQGRARG